MRTRRSPRSPWWASRTRRGSRRPARSSSPSTRPTRPRWRRSSSTAARGWRRTRSPHRWWSSTNCRARRPGRCRSSDYGPRMRRWRMPEPVMARSAVEMPPLPSPLEGVSMSRPSSPDVVVVGAGVAGLYQLHRLRGLGLSYRIFEAGSGIGGTWFWNRYPGARCDVESLEYSYSFSEELEQEWEWTERYPAQAEILQYVEHVAKRFDLDRDVELDTRVTSAAWDGERWAVTTDRPETVSARYVIFATGCLSQPKEIDIPGLESFRGNVWSTARWPHDGVDFTGRRVAVIGTGSSGVQSIPVIAQQAAELTVFQRTANYVLPARNAPLSPQAQQEQKANYRTLRRLARESPAGLLGTQREASAVDATAEERREVYEQAWSVGGLTSLRRTFDDIALNLDANRTVSDYLRDKISSIVRDPETAAALAPSDHPFGTKRPCLDTGYFQTYNLDHVQLVDLRTTPITTITAEGIQTTDRL